ncbi:Os08g0343850 [Oryza sativa Japonica Group]|uniref:Os08g0343850 protein n=1 Tax=Oryza sativa subsp. japonica TaxID=39947 RepID=A0A0P0XEM4_ORYSJ|nr:Os08g0343850 [Oryza sativa Japonica Group]
MPACSDGRARPSRERKGGRRRRDGVVDLAERRAGLNPRGGRRGVDTHPVHPREVDHHEADAVGVVAAVADGVREALVAVRAAAHADAQRGVARAQHRARELAPAAREHDGRRPGHRAGGREREPEVLDGEVEQRVVGRRPGEGEVADAGGEEARRQRARRCSVVAMLAGGTRLSTVAAMSRTRRAR